MSSELTLGKRVKKNTPPKGGGVTQQIVRDFMLALPGVEESSFRGWCAFRVRGRIIGRFRDDADSLALKCTYATREVLMGADPKTFYLTDHYRNYPWVLVKLSNVDPGVLQSLIEDAWRSLASKRMLVARAKAS